MILPEGTETEPSREKSVSGPANSNLRKASKRTTNPPLSPAQLAQRQTAALKTGRSASPENVKGLRLKMAKRVRYGVRKERLLRPWLDKSDEGLLSMLCELRITKGILIEELARKGVLGAGVGPSRRVLELEKLNTMLLRVEQALPARPDVHAGSCDLSAPDWRMPIQCLRKMMGYVNEAEAGDTSPQRDGEVATEERPDSVEEALLEEAESILTEGGQAS